MGGRGGRLEGYDPENDDGDTLPISVGGKTVAGRDGDFLVGEELLPHSDDATVTFSPGQQVLCSIRLENYGWNWHCVPLEPTPGRSACIASRLALLADLRPHGIDHAGGGGTNVAHQRRTTVAVAPHAASIAINEPAGNARAQRRVCTFCSTRPLVIFLRASTHIPRLAQDLRHATPWRHLGSPRT
jgi:hypothetical protein